MIGMLLMVGAAASAVSPAVSVDTTGDNIVVTVVGAHPAGGISARSDRLEVILDHGVSLSDVRVPDKMVKRVQIIGGKRTLLSVQLRHGRKTTRLAARASTLVIVGDNMQLVVPREPRRVLAAARSIARRDAKLAVQAASSAPAVTKDSGNVTPTPPVEASPETAAKSAKTIEPEAPVGPVDQKWPAGFDAKSKVQEPTGTGLGRSMAIAVIIALVGLSIYMARRRRRGAVISEDTLEVVAQKSLGPKSRIVLLSAGDREILVGLSDNGPQLLAQWRARRAKPANFDTEPANDSVPVEVPEAMAATIPVLRSVEPRRPAPAAPQKESPAVAGIIRLRERMPQNRPTDVSPEVRTEDADADAEWARELFLATRKGALGR